MATRLARIRFLDESARFISTVLSPLLTPSYGVFLALSISPKVLDNMGTRINLLLIIFGITCVLPMVTIAVLHNFKVIKDKRLIKRKDRLKGFLMAPWQHTIARHRSHLLRACDQLAAGKKLWESLVAT